MNDFNQNYAKDGNQRTSRGQLIPILRLPDNFEFGKNFYSQDLRLSKIFQYRERYKLTVFGEVFNMFNIANRYNVAAVSPLFTNAGQATAAYDPRQFQFGMKVKW